MWWQSKLDRTVADLIGILKMEVEHLRLRHERDLERIDRLVEALARKANVDLIMPLPPVPPAERIHVPNPWKDPNPVTDVFPSQNVDLKVPQFSTQKEKQ